MARSKSLFICITIAFLLSACAYPISKGLRQEAKKSPDFASVLKEPDMYIGHIVIWGGEIISTTTLKEGSEIMVLETPLDYGGEPEDSEYSRGRFIAKGSVYLDPEVYRKGRKVTVAGQIIGSEKRDIGEMAYTYPVIGIKEIHLWKLEMAYYPAYYGYGWYGFGPYYGPYWGPPFAPWPYWWY